MSILVNQEGRAVAIAYTAPYKKTAELVKHLDLIYERLEVVADAEDPIFKQTWANYLQVTISVGEYKGRNVFLTSDISSMIEGHVWR